MAKKASKKSSKKSTGEKKAVDAIRLKDDKRTNIPMVEMESVVSDADKAPKQIRYPRNTDLDPQLVWRGKDEQDWSDLVVNAPPLYIQEKVHPKVLIDDLLRQTEKQEKSGKPQQLDLFADFNGVAEGVRQNLCCSNREQLTTALGTNWQEWEILRELPAANNAPDIRVHSRPLAVKSKKDTTANERELTRIEELHAEWWKNRIARQKEIDASIAAKAEFEFLYDKPYEDRKRVRVAGPFTVESLSPHRVLGVDEDDELIDPLKVHETGSDYSTVRSFDDIILENLRTAGVQQAHKEDRITFTSLVPWPGDLVCAEGRYMEGTASVPSPPGKWEKVADRPDEGADAAATEKRAAIFIGPEFGTVSRPDLVSAARGAKDAGFDVLIACAFNYEAHATEFTKIGRIPVLKARMNADLHMGNDLKNTGKGNLFVIFGEPDIDILAAEDDQIQVKINGVDIFKPQTGEVESSNADGIACWFIDTDYNEESFFVRHAYFLGQNDPYKSLKTTLKSEINEDAWQSLHSDTSRPFEKPSSGRIAVKVINHLGDEVMKVFRLK